MQSFVEEVQIHEEENERGQFLKSISFRFPVYYNGKEIRKIEPGEEGLKKYADELTKENLEGWDKEKTDETVVQLSKGDIDRDSSERKSIAKTDDIGMISGYNKGNKAPETTNVKIDFSLENLDLSELRGKATYEQIKDYVTEQAGFRVSTLYISQVKRKCGLEVGESYNKP